MNDGQLRLLDRIYRTTDGYEFVEEYLKPLLFQNHMEILKEGRAHRDEIVGYGICLKEMIDSFQSARDLLEHNRKAALDETEEQRPDWT